MQTELNTKIEELQGDATTNKDQCEKLLEKVKSCKAEIEELREKNQAQAIDHEANQIELDMLKDEKQELLQDMTTQAKLESEDIVN